jgi:hypothetical protein
MLEAVDRMTDRITNLEAILDADHPNWRNEKEDNRWVIEAEIIIVVLTRAAEMAGD